MKKLFNSRFLIILASSLIVLILLSLGAFYLFDDDDDTFMKSGYVLNPLSSTSEKYYFEEDAGYKENLSSMIEFEDKDKKTVSVLKDSFLHYDDESMSFLKRGAILDLDSANGNKAVSFYNISEELIFEKKDGGYVIEASSGDVILNNFIGRISDNKYIVVGDLSLKMAGNDTIVKGKYFEVVYVEEGIVNIENKDVKYQVTAEGTSISVSNKIIDLGDKKIVVDGNDLMSITAITIDGDENIELIPKGNSDEETEDGDGSGGGGAGSGDGDGTGDGTGEGTGTGEGAEGTGDGSGGQVALVNDIVITLKDYETKSTSIKVEFDIEGAKEEDSFRLQVVNLASGRTVEMPAHQVVAASPLTVGPLSPSTKYLFTVINNKDEGKYFQKIIETNSFGIKLEKSYATSNSLAYNISLDENSDISNANISLKAFDEGLKDYKLINVKSLSSFKGNYDNIVFEGLEANTIYTAVIDGIAVGVNDYGQTYEITLTSMTLKETPDYSKMTIVKNIGTSSFDLSLGSISDPHNAITEYRYLIFREEDRGNENAEPITSKVSTNASPVNFVFGSGEGELSSGVNYYFKAVVEYFDNEKYVDFITDGSLVFTMERGAYVTIEEVEEATTQNYFKADITIADSTCMISMPGREGCPAAESPVSITVSKVTYDGSDVSMEPIKTFDNVVFDTKSGVMTKTIEVDGLEPGTTYDVSVKSIFDVDDTARPEEIDPSETSRRIITTKDLASFNIDWRGKTSEANEKHVVYATAQLLAIDPKSNEISTEESLKEISRVVMRLYDGSVGESELDTAVAVSKPVTISGNIKERFFDNPYLISSYDTFDVDIEYMKERSGGELNANYTIYFEAYTYSGKKVKLVNKTYSYSVPEHLRKDIKDPTLSEPILRTNSEMGYLFKDLKGGTGVAYELTGSFDRDSFLGAGYDPVEMNFYVYDENKQPLKFYIVDEKGKLIDEPVQKVTVPLEKMESASARVVMGYGTIYDEETIEKIMARGNRFYVGFDITCINMNTKETEYLPKNADEDVLTTGIYKLMSNAIKQTPTIINYISKSTNNSVTYKYRIEDPDNSIYIKGDVNEQSAIYANINGLGEKSFKLEKTDDKNLKSFTISGLSGGYKYQLYYYTILKKFEKDEEGNVIPSERALRGNDEDGTILFDEFYDLQNKGSSYDFTYDIINNPLTDNKVTVKINATEDVLNRILSYKIVFRDQKGNSYVVNETDNWKLSECPNEVGATPRCISVKYDDLKKMISDKEKGEKNYVTVSVEAVYDIGYAGFDYTVGLGSTNDYKYCILQTNNRQYISTTKGYTLEPWTEKLQVPRGYYTCDYDATSDKFEYTSQLFSHDFGLSEGMGENGYKFTSHLVTPKMVAVSNMKCYGTDCNKFYFDTIQPKISVSKPVPIINGSKYTLQLTGVSEEYVDIVKEDGKRYLYIEVWERENEAGAKDANGNIDKKYLARPTIKVELGKNPLDPVSVVIDGLKEYNKSANTGTYYFKIYANMVINGQKVYQELSSERYANDFKPETYVLTSASPGNLFQNFSAAEYIMSETEYGNRSLKTVATLLPYSDGSRYANDVKFVYVLCNMEGECTTSKNIFKQEDATYNSDFKMDILIDLSKEKLGLDIEYAKKYRLYVYAIAPYYTSYKEESLQTREILISRNSNTNIIDLVTLTRPKFVVTRNAKVITVGEQKDYVVDLTISVDDPYQTLIGNSNIEGQEGKYFVRFLDKDDVLSGSMQILDAEGNVVNDIPNYENYPLDAFEKPLNVRIRGLKPNSKYTVTVFGDAYLNNATLPLDNRIVSVESAPYTVYSSSDYGIAFGDLITYTANDNDVTVTFVGGSTFDNVVSVNYTVQRVDANLKEHPEYKFEGEHIVGEGSFKFDTQYKFVIDDVRYRDLFKPEIDDTKYIGDEITILVTISFDVKDPETGKISTITREQIPGFEGTAVYTIK